jgi:hypothetical protein
VNLRFPVRYDDPADDPIVVPQRHLAAMLASRRIRYLDLLEARQAPTTGLFVPMDNCPLNAVGNQTAAEAIVRW